MQKFSTKTLPQKIAEISLWSVICFALLIGLPWWMSAAVDSEKRYGTTALDNQTRIEHMAAAIAVYHKNINQCREYCDKEPLAQAEIPSELPGLEKMHKEYKEHLRICLQICVPPATPVPTNAPTAGAAFMGATAGVMAGEAFRQLVK